jgi:hypothetical protein
MVLAVQGITPDRESLASDNALRILWGYHERPDVEGDCLGDLSTSQVTEESDDCPGARWATAIVPAPATGCMSELDPFRCSFPRSAFQQADRVMDFFVHLRC